MKKMKIQEPPKFNGTAEQLTSALKEQRCFGVWDMEFNSNEEYLKGFPLRGPTLGSQTFANLDLEDCQSSPQIVMQEACQEGNPVQEEPYIEQECDGNLKSDERNESQGLVLDEDLAPMQESVQESVSAELVYQQVDNEMVAALVEITPVNGSDKVEAVNETAYLMIDAVEKTTISEICDLRDEETVDLMVGVVKETTTTTTTMTTITSVNFDEREGPIVPTKEEVIEEFVIEPTSNGDLKPEEDTIDWMADVVAATTPTVASLGLEVELSNVVTKEIMEETSMERGVEQGEVGETTYHVMMHHVDKRLIGDGVVKLEEAIESMADVVGDANIEVVESTVAMGEFGNISTVQAEGGLEEETKSIRCCIDKIMDSG